MSRDLAQFLKKKRSLDPFTQQVIELILKIPRGRVATYGQIAELAGKPRNARQVGFILRTICNEQVPWQRVIAASGKIAFPKRNKNYQRQRRLLEAEHVACADGQIDLGRHRWKKTNPRQPKLFAW